MKWMLQEVGDVRNIEWLLRKAAGFKQSQPETGPVCAATKKVTGVGLPNLREQSSHHSVSRAQDTKLQDLMLAILSFSLALVLLFSIPLLLPSGWEYLPLFTGNM